MLSKVSNIRPNAVTTKLVTTWRV